VSADYSTYYSVTHADEFRALGLDWPQFYADANARTAEARQRLRVEPDVPFGPLNKQALDVYHAVFDDASLPVFVFFHGGGYREGDRAHYGFVAPPYAAIGVTTVIPSYRLLPEFGFAEALADAVSAVSWVSEAFPGRPIVLSGHSAGGVLAARIGFARADTLGGVYPSTIAGVIAISSSYDLTNELVPEYLLKSFSSELRRWASPLLNVSDVAPRAAIAVGELEASYHGMARRLAAEVERRGTKVDLLLLDGLAHDQTVVALADPSSPLHKTTASILMSSRNDLLPEGEDGRD